MTIRKAIISVVLVAIMVLTVVNFVVVPASRATTAAQSHSKRVTEALAPADVQGSEPCKAAITVSQPAPYAAPYQEIEFDGSASTPSGAIRKYEWDFGDGSPKEEGVKVTHCFKGTKSYPVKLTVTDVQGHTCEATHPVEVKIKNLWIWYAEGDNNLNKSLAAYKGYIKKVGTTNHLSDYGLSVIALIDMPGTDQDGIWWLSDYDKGWRLLEKPIGTSPEYDLGSPATLKHFLDFVKDFTADRYILDLFDHGGGWKGIIFDEHPEDNLYPIELRKAFAESGMHFDLLFLHACEMDMVEVAYEVRDYATVTVASEEVALVGWDLYTPVLPWLSQNPDASPQALGRKILDEYIKLYANDPDRTMAVLDNTKMPAVKTALNDLAHILIDKSCSDNFEIWEAIRNTKNISPAKDYKDILSFTKQLDKRISDAQVKAADDAVRTAVGNAVLYEGQTLESQEGLYGMSVWLPCSGYNMRDFISWYDSRVSGECAYEKLQFAQDTKWGEFLMRQVMHLDWPEVVPALNAKDVPLDAVINVKFNQDIKAGDDFANVALWTSSGPKVPTTNTIAGDTLTLKPNALLHTGTSYTVSIPRGGVKSAKADDLFINVPFCSDFFSEFTTTTVVGQKLPTKCTLTGPSHVMLHEKIPLEGTLLTSDDKPVQDEITVLQLYDSSKDWEVSGSTKTDERGHFSGSTQINVLSYGKTGWVKYKAKYEGSDKYGPCTSEPVTVTVTDPTAAATSMPGIAATQAPLPSTVPAVVGTIVPIGVGVVAYGVSRRR